MAAVEASGVTQDAVFPLVDPQRKHFAAAFRGFWEKLVAQCDQNKLIVPDGPVEALLNLLAPLSRCVRLKSCLHARSDGFGTSWRGSH